MPSLHFPYLASSDNQLLANLLYEFTLYLERTKTLENSLISWSNVMTSTKNDNTYYLTETKYVLIIVNELITREMSGQGGRQ